MPASPESVLQKGPVSARSPTYGVSHLVQITTKHDFHWQLAAIFAFGNGSEAMMSH